MVSNWGVPDLKPVFSSGLEACTIINCDQGQQGTTRFAGTQGVVEEEYIPNQSQCRLQ